MKIFFIFFSVVAPLVAATCVDYCQMNCTDPETGNYYKHIGCQPPFTFDRRKCPPSTKAVRMTRSMKKIIVDAHNKRRNLVAGGLVPNHSPACRMATMQWDDNLANLAAITALQCKEEYDHCHYTNEFQFSGQNIKEIGWSPPNAQNYAEIMEDIIELWYEKAKNSNKQIIFSFPGDSGRPPTSQFTTMSIDRNIRVGCAATTYIKFGMRYLLAFCNYAIDSIKWHPIYKACKTPAEDCTTGTNPLYKYLCSVDEVYDVNKWF